MSCSKYTLTNSGVNLIDFNYRKCDNSQWLYQVELLPGQTKNIWLIDGTFSIAPSFIGGGYCNTSLGYFSTIGGGRFNSSSGYTSTIGGGRNNISSGPCSFIGGGYNNIASGYRSSILGGQSNNTNTCVDAMIVGSNITSDRACTTFVNNLSIMNIPTSGAGLPSGSVYRVGNALCIVI